MLAMFLPTFDSIDRCTSDGRLLQIGLELINPTREGLLIYW
jgi:hypothetical protein